MDDTEKLWTAIATRMLVGRRIKRVFYMDRRYALELGWQSRPLIIVLDNDECLYPSRDDEGNDAGALFTSVPNNPVLPVLY